MVHILTFLGLYRKEAFEMMVSRVIEVDLKKRSVVVYSKICTSWWMVSNFTFYIEWTRVRKLVVLEHW